MSVEKNASPDAGDQGRVKTECDGDDYLRLMYETPGHFGVSHDPSKPYRLADGLELEYGFHPTLWGADWTKRFRVTIDYDPDWRFALIQTQQDGFPPAIVEPMP